LNDLLAAADAALYRAKARGRNRTETLDNSCADVTAVSAPTALIEGTLLQGMET
jgi:hypothetical protein